MGPKPKRGRSKNDWKVKAAVLFGSIKVEEVYDKIITGLRKRGYTGEVYIRAVYARYNQHITPELESNLRSLNISCRHLGYADTELPAGKVADKAPKDIAEDEIYDPERPKNARRDIADIEIKSEISQFISLAPNAPPCNIMTITGDHGFEKKLVKVNEKGYRTLAAFRQDASKEALLNNCVYDSWFWRMLLSLREKAGRPVKEEVIEKKRSRKKIRTKEEEGMDSSSPVAFVNGALLRRCVGQKVRAVVQVIWSDTESVIGKSTDNQRIVIKGLPPSPLTTYLEVIGIAKTENTIRAQVWTNFGNNFDAQNYNELCRLADGEFRHLFI